MKVSLHFRGAEGGGDPRAGGLCNPGRSLELGLDLLRPVQGCWRVWRGRVAAKRCAGLPGSRGAPPGPGKRSPDSLHWSDAIKPSLLRPGQALSPGMPEAQGKGEAWFLNYRVPQKHFAAIDFEVVYWPFSRSSSARRRA